MLRLEHLAREVVMRWERGDLAEAVRALDQRLQEIAQGRVRQRGLIERAIELYMDSDNNIAIDVEDALISEGQQGAFVMGWLWVARCDENPTIEAHADATVHAQDDAKPP